MSSPPTRPIPGTVFGGRYRLVEELGRGGMGWVFRAYDIEIDEHVAIKLLDPQVAFSAGTVERFHNELRFARRIAHKNICKIYHLEKQGDTPYIIMEYVSGEDLKSLVRRRGRLSQAEILSIAGQVCEGLAEAHRMGVVHRDLKPQNIMVGPDGQAKIMDFGIARSIEAHGLTATGVMIGTPEYMSPEQAWGEEVDHRSDIYSLGVLLFELAVGTLPFSGKSPVGIATKHRAEAPPDPRELNPDLPEELRQLILVCLAKEPESRYQSAEELLAHIRALERNLPSGERILPFSAPLPPSRAGPPGRLVTRWRPISLFAGVSLLIVTIAFAVWSLIGLSPTRPLTIAQVTRVTFEDGAETYPSLSPEGNLIAYAASGELFLRRIGTENPILLTEDFPLEASEPAFSPDGRLIAFSARLDVSDVRGGIWLMEVMGAGKRRLTDAGFSPAWSPDGTEIAYATEIPLPYERPRLSSVFVVDVASGQTREVNPTEARVDMMEPAWSPSGHRLAYWGMRTGAFRDIQTRSVEGGEETPVTVDSYVDWAPIWSGDGRYLFFCSDRSGSPNLWRVRIDEESGRVLGDPEPVTTPASAVMHVDFVPDGSGVAFEASDLQANVYRLAFDPVAGAVRGDPVAVTSGTRVWVDVDVSVGGRLALRSAMGEEDIWVADEDGTNPTRLAPDQDFDRFPRWSPDGRRIAFSSTKGGEGYEIYSIRPDGLDLRRHTFFDRAVHFPLWSPDGLRLAFTEYVSGTRGLTYVIGVDAPWPTEGPTVLLTPPEPVDLRYRPWSWSADGRRVVAYSQRGAGMIVYDLVTGAYEGISDVGEWPRWLSDSRRIVYASHGALYLIDAQTKISRELYHPPAGEITSLAVAPDDRAIYFILRRDDGNILFATIR